MNAFKEMNSNVFGFFLGTNSCQFGLYEQRVRFGMVPLSQRVSKVLYSRLELRCLSRSKRSSTSRILENPDRNNGFSHKKNERLKIPAVASGGYPDCPFLRMCLFSTASRMRRRNLIPTVTEVRMAIVSSVWPLLRSHSVLVFAMSKSKVKRR